MTDRIRIDGRGIPTGITVWDPPELHLRGTIRQNHRLLQCQVGEIFVVTVKQTDGTDTEREVPVLIREEREDAVMLGLRFALENGTPVDITMEIERPPLR